MKDVKAKIKEARKKADRYDEIFDPQGLINVADIIVDNKILIDKVDAILGKKSNISSKDESRDEISILEK